MLSGTGDATGDTSVEQGTLVAGSSAAIGSGALIVNGTFDLAGYDTTVASLAGSSSGVVESSSSLATLYIDGDNTDTTFSGILQDGPDGQLALEMDGTGTQVLAAANTFTGGTTVTAGTLALAYSYDSTGTLPAGNWCRSTAAPSKWIPKTPWALAQISRRKSISKAAR